jgi:predicted nucleotidyltransferase
VCSASCVFASLVKMSWLADCVKESCAEHRVIPLFAFVCGSRAWGIESSCSDYDLRVLFWPVDEDDERNVETFSRDVVAKETKVEVQGWDIRKAVALHCSNNNASLAEWLAAPEVAFSCDNVLLRSWRGCVLDGRSSHEAFQQHYAGLLKSERRRNLGGRREVVLAEYLHAARPALMLNALLQDARVFPAVDFRALLDIAGVPAEAKSFLSELANKKSAGELRKGEEGPHNRACDDWFDLLEKAPAVVFVSLLRCFLCNKMHQRKASALLVRGNCLCCATWWRAVVWRRFRVVFARCGWPRYSCRAIATNEEDVLQSSASS